MIRDTLVHFLDGPHKGRVIETDRSCYYVPTWEYDTTHRDSFYVKPVYPEPITYHRRIVFVVNFPRTQTVDVSVFTTAPDIARDFLPSILAFRRKHPLESVREHLFGFTPECPDDMADAMVLTWHNHVNMAGGVRGLPITPELRKHWSYIP